MVILNPAAGRGRARRFWPRIQSALRQALGTANVDVMTTAGPGEAVTLAARAAEQPYDLIIACGGDGTLHEVINGVYRSPNPKAIALIPAGTGNDFARSLGISLDPVRVAAGLENSELVRVDLGIVNGYYFANVAGIGFDAEVAAEVNRSGRLGGGALPYILAIGRKLMTYRNEELVIDLDGVSTTRRSLLVAVGCASYYGGGMRILPDADMTDGWFDLCLGGDLSRFATLGLLPRLFNGSHIHHPLVEMRRARQVTVTGPAHLHVHADGELIGTLPARFQCLPGGLQMALPRGTVLKAKAKGGTSGQKRPAGAQ